MDFAIELESYRKKIDAELDIFFSKFKLDDAFLSKCYEYMHQYVVNGGKRLRPAALIVAYKGYGGIEDITRRALSVELFHNSTLIHDDIMDDDTERRGRPTYHMKMMPEFEHDKAIDGTLFSYEKQRFAISQAIIAGNILYSQGESLLADNRRAMRLYCDTYTVVNHGQAQDIRNESKDITEKEYISMVQKKTAALLKASSQIGAVLASADDKQVRLIGEAMFNAGIAFQLQDDIMDIDPKAKKGHEIGSDIVQGKRTLLVIKAAETKPEIMQMLGNNDKVADAIKLMHETGALDYTVNLAKKYITKSKQLVARTSMNEDAKQFFTGFSDFMLNRLR